MYESLFEHDRKPIGNAQPRSHGNSRRALFAVFLD
jgi:hypothetical protein